MDTPRFEILFLSLESAVNDPWTLTQKAKPTGVAIHKLPLTLSPETWNLPAGHKLSHILVDLDSVGKTKGLDKWAITAWRATINEWVVKNLVAGQTAVEVVGFCREATWNSARLGTQLGVRDLLTTEDLDSKFNPDAASTTAAPEPKGQLFSFADLKNRIGNKPEISAVNSPKSEEKIIPPAAHTAELAAAEVSRHTIPFPIEGLDGQSAGIEAVRMLIRRTAPLDTPVLITGATGSGKELVAQTLHKYSARASAPFIAVNCGAISANLVESELFGHTKGSFTGATHDRIGLLQAANGGTLFLDELTDLSLEMQVKFLRALQEKIIYPVGSTTGVSIDFRLISATKDDIEEKVREGKFREDLYYRLKVIEIALPSLAERRGDMIDITRTLAKHIARKHRQPTLEIDDHVLEKFLLYSWPGNIRELDNVIERASTLAWAENRKNITLNDLPEEIRFSTMSTGNNQHLKEVVKRFEREYIATTVRRLGGSKELAADSLGLSLATLYRKIGA